MGGGNTGVCGAEHVDTLVTASTLAFTLALKGDTEAAEVMSMQIMPMPCHAAHIGGAVTQLREGGWVCEGI